MNHPFPSVAKLIVLASLAPAALAQEQSIEQKLADTRYLAPSDVMPSWERAIASGLVPDPALRPAIQVQPRHTPRGLTTCLAPEQIFAYEDTDQVLLTNFSTGELIGLMNDATNAVIQAWGDNYDFIGFWVNFTPHHQIGAAFYLGIENDVLGIGNSVFNARPDFGLLGDNVEGYVMMWDINDPFWQPGAGGAAAGARLVLGQEFEHRFGMFLPPAAGRELQGDNGPCGRSAHWNFKVDGQGSSMEISDWLGTSPAIWTPTVFTTINFNTDIPGGVWSYPDLYLMGYVSPAEMDAGMADFRYMDNAACFNFENYNGPITQLSSSDIVASAGPRIPDSAASQKDFRTAWVMIHLPGDAPSTTERNKATSILEQHTIDWDTSTLGRGTMDNSLFLDLDCDGVPDAQGCNNADLAVPFGTLDFDDVLAFLTAFGTMGPAADLAPPMGVFDFDDVLAFLGAFGSGCP